MAPSKPKSKLRELRAIQRDQEAFHRTLERLQEYHQKGHLSEGDESGEESSNGSGDEEDSSSSEAPPVPRANTLIMDREAKKVLQLEMLFQKREREIKRKQEMRERREQRKIIAQLKASGQYPTGSNLVMIASGSTKCTNVAPVTD